MRYLPKINVTLERFFRFATIGVFCVLFNWTLNYCLLVFYHTPLIPTYWFVYIVSIFVSFLLNSSFTYYCDKTLKNLKSYYLIYLSSMFLGTVLITFYQSVFNFESWIYPMMVTPITMLWNFFNSSKAFVQKSQSL